jgi:hypothetical protein
METWFIVKHDRNQRLHATQPSRPFLILQWQIKQVTGYGSILLSSRENLGLMVGPTAADGGVDLVFASTDVVGSSPVTYTLLLRPCLLRCATSQELARTLEIM